MRSYIQEVVWPGSSDLCKHTLRAVLYGKPFCIRSPEQLDKEVAGLAHQVGPERALIWAGGTIWKVGGGGVGWGGYLRVKV